MLQKTPWNFHFFENLRFCDDFWPPKCNPNRPKTLKMQCLRTSHFWYQFSIDFSRCWPSKRKPKSNFFRACIENADFAKIVVFRRKIAIFQVWSFQKSIKTRWKNAFKNNIAKKLLENPILASVLASKILRKRFEKRRGTKLVSRRYGNCPEVVASQRASAFVKHPNG